MPVFSTKHLKTKKETDWFLAVPTTLVRTATVTPAVPRCPDCGEPKMAHPGSHYEYPSVPLGNRMEAMAKSVAEIAGSVEQDIFKASNWSSYQTIGEESRWYQMHFLGWKKREQVPPYQWTRVVLARELYFSIRLDAIFKSVGSKGLYGWEAFGTERLNPDECAWVEQKRQLLDQHGLGKKTSTKRAPSLDRWFSTFLKKNKTNGRADTEFVAVEKAHGVQLPSSYKEFISTVGEMTFQDVDDCEGFAVSILSPDRIDFQRFRIGNTEVEDAESREIDGVIFASTEYWDCYCFDVSDGPEYPVYIFNDELHCFEAYAGGFKECIKRFAGE